MSLTGFDESLAVVIARRAAGEPCPWTGDATPLASDPADAAALVAKARAAPPSARRHAILALLGATVPAQFETRGCMRPSRPAHTLNEITTGDARRLAASIPDGSVDLVFCDPVYQNIADYGWLARTALRVLKPRGVLLAWASVPKAGRAQAAMERAGAAYVYTLFYTVTAKTYRMRWYNLFCWTTPCLWFQRSGEATRPNQWMPDTFSETVLMDNTVVSSANPSNPFEWNKNTGVLMRWIERFSPPGSVVYDPFAGSGSVPVACRATGRAFYASEINPERAEEARRRLDVTPAPLPLLAPATQEAMAV